jgi:hypothetical protein
MARTANAKKKAAQAWGKMKALEAATTEGKYMIARVEKALGFCQFTAKLEMTDGSLRDVTVLVRGKFKGGKGSATCVDPGCFVMVEGDISRILEVVGVVNRQSDMERLRKSGRVSKKLLGEHADIDDLFDRSEEESKEEGHKTKKREEGGETAAEELVGRYRQKAEAGSKLREGIVDVTRSRVEVVVTGLDDEEAIRARRRAKKASATVEMAAIQSKPAEVGQPQELEHTALSPRKTPNNWDDDEIDIDAI